MIINRNICLLKSERLKKYERVKNFESVLRKCFDKKKK